MEATLRRDESAGKIKLHFKKEVIRVERFRSERQRDWGHPRDSVDAISFVPQLELQFKGFIQYEVTDWKGHTEVHLQVALHENGSQVYGDRLTLKKKQCKNNKIEIHFNDQVTLHAHSSYDLALRNTG